MKKLLLAPALLFSAQLASAQVLAPGDLVVAYPNQAGSTVESYGAGGAVNLSLTTSDTSWIAAALLPDGRLVFHNNSGLQELRYYNQDGTFDSSFQISVAFYASDIDAYANGDVALCSRFEGIKVYSPTGQLVTVHSVPEMIAPMGCQVQPDQSIWVADLLNFPDATDGRVLHLDSAGNLLSYFDVPYDAADVATAPDGTLWVVSFDGQVEHYNTNGTLIASWTPTFDSTLHTTWSLAVDGAGEVWISGHYDSKIRGYDLLGNVLHEFDTTAQGNSTFMFMVPGSTWVREYCFGDGSSGLCPCANNSVLETGCANSTGVGAHLTGSGSSDALADNLTLHVTGLPASQPVLLFSANNEIAPSAPSFLFGDGFRCAGGFVQRLGVVNASSMGDAFWGPNLQAAGGWGPGDVRRFQAWYRDPVNSPCGTLFNLSNGLEVTFQP
jgi:sugar lactone lactonase YvrE